jgi:copper chaperone CopZ
MKAIKILCVILLLTASVYAQKKSVVLIIQTSAECSTCKKALEQGLAYEKGVKFTVLDVPSKILSVTYNPDKTSPEKIKHAISKLGYDADDVKADSAAYAKLPSCCKVGGH